MMLFHGSSVAASSPLVNIGRKELDFGPGFYLTQIREQAERWAKRVCVVRKSQTPIISKFLFDEKALPSDIRHLVLPYYDQDWLDFIVASRRGQQPWADYDIIEGGVANDQVIDTVEDYFAGRITVEQAIGQLKYATPTHQMCINSQAVVDGYLHFEGYEPLSIAL